MTDQERTRLRKIQDTYIAWCDRRQVPNDRQVIQCYPTGEFITLQDLRTTLYPHWEDYFKEPTQGYPLSQQEVSH